MKYYLHASEGWFIPHDIWGMVSFCQLLLNKCGMAHLQVCGWQPLGVNANITFTIKIKGKV